LLGSAPASVLTRVFEASLTMSEAFSRGRAIIWAVSLGILTAFTAGSTITVASLGAEAWLTVLLFLVTTPILYVLINRRWDQWAREQPLVRIVVYFLPLFFGTVFFDVLVDTLVGGIFGWGGIVLTLLDTVVAALVFTGAVWLAFYGGAYRVRDVVIERFDVQW